MTLTLHENSSGSNSTTIGLSRSYGAATTAPVSSGRMPTSIPASQRYYWSRKWQMDEAASELDLANGDYEEFSTSRDAIMWLLDPTED